MFVAVDGADQQGRDDVGEQRPPGGGHSAIMSSCGFGDIVPTTAVERLLSCFLMWTGSIIYSFMLGSFAALMQARTVSLILLC